MLTHNCSTYLNSNANNTQHRNVYYSVHDNGNANDHEGSRCAASTRNNDNLYNSIVNNTWYSCL